MLANFLNILNNFYTYLEHYKYISERHSFVYKLLAIVRS